MASADKELFSFEYECWNEVCEDVDCDDTNFHSTTEELMDRIKDSTRDLDVISEAEDIVLQAELKSNEDN
jgi:hypothetical protein